MYSLSVLKLHLKHALSILWRILDKSVKHSKQKLSILAASSQHPSSGRPLLPQGFLATLCWAERHRPSSDSDSRVSIWENGKGDSYQWLIPYNPFSQSVSISPGNIRLVNGVSSGLEVMAWILTDPGDVMLVPVPTYGRLERVNDNQFIENSWQVLCWHEWENGDSGGWVSTSG